MSLIDGMSYSQWQQRNTNYFNKLPKNKKLEARDQGYFNVGWEKVKKSWKVLIEFIEIPSIFDHNIKKGDISGAINLSILEAEQAQKIAKSAVKNLNHKRKELNNVSKNILNKYQVL